MKHCVALVVAALLTFGSAFDANARVVGTCSIEATLEITSIHFGWGGSGGEGEGMIKCSYSDGTVEHLPISLEVWGAGVGIGVSKSVVQLRARNVKISDWAEDELLGRFALARAGGNNGDDGQSKFINFNATRNSLTIPFRAEVEDGSGFELAANLGGIRIERERTIIR